MPEFPRPQRLGLLPTHLHVSTLIFWAVLSFLQLDLGGGLHCTACGILVPRSGIEPVPLAVKAQSPNHWTTKKSPGLCFLCLLLAAVGLDTGSLPTTGSHQEGTGAARTPGASFLPLQEVLQVTSTLSTNMTSLQASWCEDLRPREEVWMRWVGGHSFIPLLLYSGIFQLCPQTELP